MSTDLGYRISLNYTGRDIVSEGWFEENEIITFK